MICYLITHLFKSILGDFMKKLVLVLLVLFLVGGFSVAQETASSVEMAVSSKNQYAGVALGYPISGHYGMRDVFGNGDLRLRVATPFFIGFGAGVDVLFDFSDVEIGDDLRLQIYAGPSVSAAYYSVGVGTFSISPGGVVGGELFFTDSISGFIEIGAAYNIFFNSAFSNLGVFAPTGGLGVNFGF